MTTLMTASIIAFGVFGFRLLPVSALPKVDFPTIAVTATLPGASADTMAASVAGPIERQLSTIAGISSMSSTSSQGTTAIVIQFDLNRNIDAAALDVQTALTIAQRRLPIEMTIPPTFRKVNPSDLRSCSSRWDPRRCRFPPSTNTATSPLARRYRRSRASPRS
jgi:HAE1 family hydrophobic/amphiphilic exporter-1